MSDYTIIDFETDRLYGFYKDIEVARVVLDILSKTYDTKARFNLIKVEFMDFQMPEVKE